METIKKTVLIDAPVNEVFDFFTDANHLLEIWPSMVEIKNARSDEKGGHSFDWTYKMAFMHFHGHAETIEVKPNELRVVKNEKGIPSTFRWTYVPRGKQTEVKVEVEYELPVPLIGKLAEPFLRKINERDAETLLANLKERFEAGKGVEVVPPVTAGARPEPTELRH